MAEMNQAQREEELARREALLAQREAQLEKEQAELAAAKAQSAKKKRLCWTTTIRISSTPRKSSTINSPYGPPDGHHHRGAVCPHSSVSGAGHDTHQLFGLFGG